MVDDAEAVFASLGEVGTAIWFVERIHHDLDLLRRDAANGQLALVRAMHGHNDVSHSAPPPARSRPGTFDRADARTLRPKPHRGEHVGGQIVDVEDHLCPRSSAAAASIRKSGGCGRGRRSLSPSIESKTFVVAQQRENEVFDHRSKSTRWYGECSTGRRKTEAPFETPDGAAAPLRERYDVHLIAQTACDTNLALDARWGIRPCTTMRSAGVLAVESAFSTSAHLLVEREESSGDRWSRIGENAFSELMARDDRRAPLRSRHRALRAFAPPLRTPAVLR